MKRGDCEMKKKSWVILGIISVIFIITIVSVLSKDYWVSTKDNFIPYAGGIDIYNASREELIELDLCDYPGVFGEVKNEKEACQVAEKVIKEVYQNDEYPYIVKYNKNANAWIVSGSRPLFYLGGIASIAIDKDTGEILMLIHTK